MLKRRKQQGVALLIILLVVALGTVMTASLIAEQQASIQATRGFLDRGQARQYALGGEELARQILHEDFLEAPEKDHAQEAWASQELVYEFEEGEVMLQIVDLQGLFNLNILSLANSAHEVARQRLARLIAALGGSPELVDRIQDWIDEDQNVRPAGGEDFTYQVFEPPYRSGSMLMAEPSEIALLGMDPEFFQQLIPWLCALPEVNSTLNVNAAAPVVLQSLAPGLSYEAAEALVQRQYAEEGFDSVQAFLQSPELAGLGVAEAGLGVQSRFFQIRAIARYRDRFSYLASILYRDSLDGSMKILYRDFSKNINSQPPAQAEDQNV